MNAVRFSIITVFLSICILNITAQDELSDIRLITRLTNEADGYFIYDENYTEAASIYEKLMETQPGNHNLNYKLGVCYLNMTGKKKKALELLEYASSSWVDDPAYSTLGDKSPIDVNYYLAFAYQVNMELEKAVESYKKYRNLLKVTKAGEIEYIDIQIKACLTLLSADTSMMISRELLAPWLTDFRNAINPVISGNDSVFVFTVKEKYENRIYCSYKNTGSWSVPENISDDLGNYKDMYTNSITKDGKTLVISRNNGIRGDIYLSHRINGNWSRLDKFGKNVNTKYWESHACISNDGTMLYFASNMPGGYGSLDIYSAELDDKFNASQPVNLGPVINTSLEENTPYYDSKTGTLYFSSTGHEGFGGYDIFYSRKDRTWSYPVHIPYPINTTSDDLNFVPRAEGSGILSIPPDDTSSFSNIYIVGILGKAVSGHITAMGNVSLEDGLDIIPSQLEISVYAAGKDSLLASVRADSSGSFSSELQKGMFDFIFRYPGYITDTVNLCIPESYEQKDIYITGNLIPEKVASGEFLAIRNILFGFDSTGLKREAKIEIEKIIPVLLSHPDLNIIIEGYADAIGSASYNKKLSMERAVKVRDYLVKAGIDINRLSTKAPGEVNFITDNFTPNGKDNPTGRIYNRRVSINIKNNGYLLPVESYLNVPVHLKKPYNYGFYVVIKESATPLSAGFFSTFGISQFSFINEYRLNNNYIYALGGFRTRLDALSCLTDLTDKGFKNSYIITEYDLPESSAPRKELPELYTIQIHALKNKASGDFRGLENVREVKSADGFYRYIIGEYQGYSRARQALSVIHDAGYGSAFIKAIDILEKQTLQDRHDDLR